MPVRCVLAMAESGGGAVSLLEPYIEKARLAARRDVPMRELPAGLVAEIDQFDANRQNRPLQAIQCELALTYLLNARGAKDWQRCPHYAFDWTRTGREGAPTHHALMGHEFLACPTCSADLREHASPAPGCHLCGGDSADVHEYKFFGALVLIGNACDDCIAELYAEFDLPMRVEGVNYTTRGGE